MSKRSMLRGVAAGCGVLLLGTVLLASRRTFVEYYTIGVYGSKPSFEFNYTLVSRAGGAQTATYRGRTSFPVYDRQFTAYIDKVKPADVVIRAELYKCRAAFNHGSCNSVSHASARGAATITLYAGPHYSGATAAPATSQSR